MDDLISRQAAIDALEWKWAGKAAIDAIKQLPPAHEHARPGKWSDISGQACLCSNCGKPQNYKQAMGWRYCPHCGAVME